MREEGGRDVLQGGDEARERGEKLVAKVPIDVGLQSAVGIADFGDGEGLRPQGCRRRRRRSGGVANDIANEIAGVCEGNE